MPLKGTGRVNDPEMRASVQIALEQAGGRVAEAARLLDMDRHALDFLLAKWGMRAEGARIRAELKERFRLPPLEDEEKKAFDEPSTRVRLVREGKP